MEWAFGRISLIRNSPNYDFRDINDLDFYITLLKNDVGNSLDNEDTNLHRVFWYVLFVDVCSLHYSMEETLHLRLWK